MIFLVESPHLEPEERESGDNDGERDVDGVVLAPRDRARRHGEQVEEAGHLDAPVHQPRSPAEALRHLSVPSRRGVQISGITTRGGGGGVEGAGMTRSVIK